MHTASPDQVRRLAAAIATARAALGAVVLLAPRRSMKLAGVADDLTAPGRLTTALFGVREVVLGLTVLERVRAGYPSGSLLRLNALCDAGDLVLLTTAVARRERIGRMAAGLPVAVLVAGAWVWMARRLDEV